MFENISKKTLDHFYDSRRQLDQAIGEVLGPNIHLHDISEESEKSHEFNNSFGFKEGQRQGSNERYLDVMLNFSSDNKIERLSFENSELQKRITSLQTENKNFKHKAFLWEKMKKQIIEHFDKVFKLKSIKYGSSDAAILDEFLVSVEETIAQSRENKRQMEKVDYDNNDEIEIRKKLEEEYAKTERLTLSLEILKNQNEKEKKQNSVLLEFQEKFNIAENTIVSKAKENIELKEKIQKLEVEVKAIDLPKLSLKKERDHTFSTNPETALDHSSELDILRKISRAKDEEINSLRQESKTLGKEIGSIRNQNRKMKKVIKMAQSLNDEFLGKIEESISKNTTNILHELEVSSEYMGKSESIKNDFHFANKRFKIVKTRSLEKQKFNYGQKN